MEVTAAAHAAALWSGLNLILLLVLSVRVVRQRRAHGIESGDGGIASLARAIRAFRAATAFIPAGVASLAVLALAGANPLTVHASGLLLFLGRLAEAVGASRKTSASILGAGGRVMTWIAYILAAVALVVSAVP